MKQIYWHINLDGSAPAFKAAKLLSVNG